MKNVIRSATATSSEGRLKYTKTEASVWGGRTQFGLQIGVILRREQSFRTRQAVARRLGGYSHLLAKEVESQYKLPLA